MKENINIRRGMKMYIHIHIGCMLILCNVLNAQPQIREVGYVNRVTLLIPAILEITLGTEQSLSIEGPSDIIEKVITSTDKGRLRIYSKTPLSQYCEVKVYLTVKEIYDITLTGAGDIIAKSPINTNQINLELSGSGNIRVPEFTADAVELQIAGSGSIITEGQVKEQIDINITGSGDINASKPEAKRVKINITGSGFAKVFASEWLHTNIIGNGGIYYKGNPVVEANSVGPGKTKPL